MGTQFDTRDEDAAMDMLYTVAHRHGQRDALAMALLLDTFDITGVVLHHDRAEVTAADGSRSEFALGPRPPAPAG